MSEKLFVGNLPLDMTSEEIRALFIGVVPIETCELITDRKTGRSRGYAFVELASKDMALSAKEKLNGIMCKGQALRVK